MGGHLKMELVLVPVMADMVEQLNLSLVGNLMDPCTPPYKLAVVVAMVVALEVMAGVSYTGRMGL